MNITGFALPEHGEITYGPEKSVRRWELWELLSHGQMERIQESSVEAELQYIGESVHTVHGPGRLLWLAFSTYCIYCTGDRHT